MVSPEAAGSTKCRQAGGGGEACSTDGHDARVSGQEGMKAREVVVGMGGRHCLHGSGSVRVGPCEAAGRE